MSGSTGEDPAPGKGLRTYGRSPEAFSLTSRCSPPRRASALGTLLDFAPSRRCDALHGAGARVPDPALRGGFDQAARRLREGAARGLEVEAGAREVVRLRGRLPLRGRRDER